MSDASPLEAEARGDTTTFDYFDREWTIPTKRTLKHLTKMRTEAREGFTSLDMIVAETMLGDDQFAELLEVDPDEDEFGRFVEALSKAMGLGGSGNSKSS